MKKLNLDTEVIPDTSCKYKAAAGQEMLKLNV